MASASPQRRRLTSRLVSSDSAEPTRIARLVAVRGHRRGRAVRAGAVAAGQTDHRDHPGPQAPGRRSGQRHHRTAGLRRPAIHGRVHPVHRDRDAAATGGLVFSTIPPAGIDASRNGLFVRANADTVVVAFRDTVAAVAPRPAINAGGCRRCTCGADLAGPGPTSSASPGRRARWRRRRSHRWPESSPTSNGAAAAGPFGPGRHRHPLHHRPDHPEAGRDHAGADLRAGVADRAGGPGPRPRPPAARAVAALAARPGHLAGRRRGDRHPAAVARRRRHLLRRRLQPHDRAGVRRGPATPRTYFRFFGATEAPFDWFQSVLAHLAAISTAGVWMRLPATAAGIAPG